MKKVLFSMLVFCTCCSLLANDGSGVMPTGDYRYQAGLGNDSKAVGTTEKSKIENLPQVVQIPKKQSATVVSNGVDLTNAYLLNQIESNRAKSTQPPMTNLIALPESYGKELAVYNKMLSSEKTQNEKSVKEKAERLIFVHCNVAQDYKINSDTTIKMFCRDTKSNGSRYQLNASLSVNSNKLISTPYLLENENGEVYTVNKTKSRIYNAANGSSNIATFVDKRALDKAEQGAANAFATQAPALAKDYLEQSNKADTELVQTNNGLNSTITQSTANPKPDAGDYGIALLIGMLGNGMKQGIDQLYLDLGYIYYIPRDTVVEAEIVIEVEK